MKIPRNLLAHGLAGVHLGFCLLLSVIYFGTPDPERGMVFTIFYFTDPWFIPLVEVFVSNPIFGFLFAAIFGSLAWWFIGLASTKTIKSVLSSRKNES
jgi:hypothetical protein